MAMKKNKTVDSYIANAEKWKEELKLLRTIMLQTELKEAIKWGMPIYMWNNKNVVGFCGFKNFVSVWFHQGVFLKDKHKKLINAQEGVTKALRQWRFNSKEEIESNKKLLLEYLKEATKNQKLNKEIKAAKPKKKFDIPKELQSTFSSNKNLKAAFEKLTSGKQREYCEYIAEAKRAATKEKRIEKIIPMIISGVGLHDKYKS